MTISKFLKQKLKNISIYKNKKNIFQNFHISKNSKNYLLVLGQHDHSHIF